MVMKKTTAGRIFWGGGGICILSAMLNLAGYVEMWIAAAAIVCLFPVTVLALFFWWMAGQEGGDIPFIGY
jgi:uncharacterized membrane protein YfcA